MHTVPDSTPQLLTIEEAATLAACTPSALYKHIRRGNIPARCIVRPFGPRSVRLDRAAFAAHLQASRDPEPVATPYTLPGRSKKARRSA